MKALSPISRLVLSVIMVLISEGILLSQAPQKMTYQAVIRTSDGVLLANQGVGMKISILQGSTEGTAVFRELYNPNPITNANGLVTLEIGTGIPLTGSLGAIDWSAGPYFLKVETDPTGATNYTIVGVSELLSVPYALFANKALTFTEADPVFDASAARIITSGDISDWSTAYSWGDHSLAGYVPDNRMLTINGFTQSLSTNRSWNVGTVTSVSGTGGIGGGPVTTTGTLYLTGLPFALYSLSSNGIIARTGTSTLATRTISGANGIIVTGGDGVSANPLITPSYGTTAGTIAAGNHTHTDFITTEADPTWSGDANLTAAIGRTGNVGIGITTPAALLHVTGTGTGGGNVLFHGMLKGTPGDPPASGSGTRLMWYPDKAAFRAGNVNGTNWDKDSTGQYSAGIGYNNKAKGTYSVAMGYSTSATGNGSVALGYLASATGAFATALGSNSLASGNSSTVLGNYTTASGSQSIAAGSNSTASGSISLATGSYATASGDNSTAIGTSAIASGKNALSAGDQTRALSAYEIAIGRYNREYTPASTTEWVETDRLFVIGNGTGSSTRKNALTLLKNGRLGLGVENPLATLHVHGTTAGSASILFAGTQQGTPGDPPASGAGQRLMWYPDKIAFRAGYVNGPNWDKDSIGIQSVALGDNTKAKGIASFAAGGTTSATGDYSTAMGANTVSSAMASTALGLLTTASGTGSIATGGYTKATAMYSTSMGAYSQATGYGAMASGWGPVASGEYSMAVGNISSASGNHSLAAGYSTEAIGQGSLATGLYSRATGEYSTAMGRSARALGNFSFAINLNTAAGPDVPANCFQISGATTIGGNVAWTQFSDGRLKEVTGIIAAEDNLSRILQMNAVRFRWKDNPTLVNLGFIAQEVAAIIPESVRYDATNDIWSMEYTAIIPVLVEGIKQQQSVIEAHGREIESLKNENLLLRNSLSELEQLKAEIELLRAFLTGGK